MKIAVFHNLPSGGAKRALHGIVREMIRAGHSVEAFIPDTAEEAYLSLSTVGARTHMFPVRRTVKGQLLSTLKYLPPLRISLADLETVELSIADAINESGCDAVWVEQDQFVMSPFLMKRLRRPFVYLCPQIYRSGAEKILADALDRQAGSRLRSAWRKHALARRIPVIDRANIRSARLILANSYFTRESIVREYGRSAHVCYPGVDCEIFTPREFEKEGYVLSVGSLTPGKGYDFVIRSLSRIDPGLRPRLVIVANFSDAWTCKWLTGEATRLGVSMEIRQKVCDLELAGIYARASVFVYAPYLEPLGLAPLEALAVGTPVVAVKEGGLRETVADGETGLLTERDESQFAQAVLRLLTDEPLNRQMGSRGTEVVKRQWDLPAAASRAIHFIERACDQWK